MATYPSGQNDVKKQLPLSGEELQAILTYMQEGVEAVDAEGNIVYVNPAFLALTGFKPEERIGKNINDVNPDGLLVKVLSKGITITGVRTKAPGKEKEVVANASPIYRDDRIVGAVIVCQDISELINLSKRLMESEIIKESLYNRLGNAKYSFDDIHTISTSLQKIIEVTRKISITNTNVLIEGESGVGKELFAHAIHNSSSRCKKPFVPINCAAIPENLLESEFFGYEKGSFTGATGKKIGLFELANEGTIFLDEIGEMGLNLQAKLLRVLQDHEIRRIGSTETIKINVRVIAATNQNIYQMVQEGKFRNDLYYRLNIAPLYIPPLRERKEDIPLFINHFLKKFSRSGRKEYIIDNAALQLLVNHNWPGNVRELESVIQYAVLVCNGNIITVEDVVPKLPYKKDPYKNNQQLKPLLLMEQEAVSQALQIYGNSVEGKKKAAEALGISLGTLYSRLKKTNP